MILIIGCFGRLIYLQNSTNLSINNLTLITTFTIEKIEKNTNKKHK